MLINVFIGVYIYKVIKDPENYTKEEPLKHVIPVGFKEQNMDRRRFVNQPKKEKDVEKLKEKDVKVSL